MIIDFRVRPPYKNFLDTGIFKRWTNVPVDPRKTPMGNLNRRLVPSITQKSMDLFIKEMDESEVYTAVIHGRKTGDKGTGFADIPNDIVKELMDAYPGRFEGFAGIDPCDDDALTEIKRCRDMGFKGISLEPAWCKKNMYVDDEIIYPVYSLAQELNMICSITMSGMFGPDLTYSNPIGVQHIAKAFPSLKIVIAHAAWPFFDFAIAVALVCPNVYLLPDVYLYTPMAPMSEHMLDAANTCLKYRVLFASSYPVCGIPQSVEKWKARAWIGDALEKNMYNNATELLYPHD